MPISKRRARRSAAAPRCSRAPESSCASTGPTRDARRRRKRRAAGRRARSAAGASAIEAYAAAGLDALAMEWMPRITRAQSMDILSSQSNLAGYKAVVDAADAYGRAFPMMMTAAGHDQPGQGVRDGRRRRRAAGDRHRQAPGRAGQRDRRPLGDQGADPVARRQADLRRECRRDRRRGRGRLCDGNVARNIRRRRPSWSPAISPSRTSSSPPR